jgi:hypothetical protein
MRAKLVEVRTGEIIDPGHIEGSRFWFAEEMERPGKPKGRALGRSFGIRRSGTGKDDEWVGEYAILDPSREDMADQKREEIAKLESRLNACRGELYAIYGSPLKYSATLRLVATKTVSVEALTP